MNRQRNVERDELCTRFTKWMEKAVYRAKLKYLERRKRGIKTMLRMYLLQFWLSLSDEGIEDAIYDSYALRKFSHAVVYGDSGYK